jgi:hypothetical protein
VPAASASGLAPIPADLFLVAVAAALVLLGPGALSIDARLFGRREIVVPRAPRRSEPAQPELGVNKEGDS